MHCPMAGIVAPSALLQLNETRHILIVNGIYEGSVT
jgi:hypothetical protein